TFLTSAPATIGGTLIVRAANGTASVGSELSRLIRSLDDSVQLTRLATLGERIGDSLHAERLVASFSSAFSLVALLLTGIGLYGIVAFRVAQRTSEIGIRFALGAKRSHIFELVATETLRPILIGLALGTLGTLASAGLLQSILFGVGRADLLTFIGVCVML